MSLEEKDGVNDSNLNEFLSCFEVCGLGSVLSSLTIRWSSYLDDGHSKIIPKMFSAVSPLLRYI